MRIVQVEYMSGYKLKLTFGNKEIRIVDLAERLKNAKGVFLPLKDLAFFKKVAVDDCQLSIFWPNGADICPDVLYEMSSTSSARKKAVSRGPKQKSRQAKKIARN